MHQGCVARICSIVGGVVAAVQRDAPIGRRLIRSATTFILARQLRITAAGAQPTLELSGGTSDDALRTVVDRGSWKARLRRLQRVLICGDESALQCRPGLCA